MLYRHLSNYLCVLYWHLSRSIITGYPKSLSGVLNFNNFKSINVTSFKRHLKVKLFTFLTYLYSL